VYRRAYDDPQAAWQRLGETPLYDVRIPRGFSLMRIELDGFDNVLRTVGGMAIAGGAVSLGTEEDATGTEFIVPPVDVVLDPSGPQESSEVRVPGTQLLLEDQLVRLADFRIGRNEVTNREYQEFVSAGGYKQRDLWEHEFVRNGQAITWDEAMAAFTDSTGRPGPGTWVGGTFVEGQENFPVGGISWYEAEAFARFSGRELPTVHHWRRAHAAASMTWQGPASNVETSGVAAVGQFEGTGWTGTFDMLGNVREWCANALGEHHAILGGAWDDALYAIPQTIDIPAALPPFNRAPQNGLRLVSAHDDRNARDILRQPVQPKDKIEVIAAASDEAFAAMLRNFDYSSDPLNASIDDTISIRNWTRQQISFDRGDGERIELLLYLPDSNASRHRVMIFWPSALAKLLASLDDFRLHLDFMLRAGWAVAMPVFEQTFHRGDGRFVSYRAVSGRDLTIRHVREMRRAIDYLETRPDMDTESLAFYGFSWGAALGPIALTAEPRLKVAILNQAGVSNSRHYDITISHYLPRVRQPVLQFNGRFDTNFRYEDSAKPFFDLLGSESKKHVVEPTGHFVPNSVIIGETLAWLDEHL
jgi:formylglycine-generating enzyme required for sulfatase activity